MFDIPSLPVHTQPSRPHVSVTPHPGPQSTIFAIASLARPAFSSTSSLAPASIGKRPASLASSSRSTAVASGLNGQGGSWLLDAVGWQDVEMFGAKEQGVRVPGVGAAGRGKIKEKEQSNLGEPVQGGEEEQGSREDASSRTEAKAKGKGRSNLKRKRTEFVDGMGYLADEDPFKTRLPHSDILLSIATHASHFYASHSLPSISAFTSSAPTPASNPSLSNRTSNTSLLLDEAAYKAYQAETSAASSARNKTWRAKRKEDNEIAGVETDGGEVQDRGGQSEEVEGTLREGPEKKTKRGGGKKRRDMFRQLDGDSLIALGVLMEEQVRWQKECGDAGVVGGESRIRLNQDPAGQDEEEEGNVEEDSASITATEGRGADQAGLAINVDEEEEEEDSSGEEKGEHGGNVNKGYSDSDSNSEDGDEFEKLFGGLKQGGLRPRGSLEMDDDSD